MLGVKTDNSGNPKTLWLPCSGIMSNYNYYGILISSTHSENRLNGPLNVSPTNQLADKNISLTTRQMNDAVLCCHLVSETFCRRNCQIKSNLLAANQSTIQQTQNNTTG